MTYVDLASQADLAGTRALRLAASLRQRFPSVPDWASGTDRSNSVEVSVDQAGTPRSARILPGWRDRLALEDLSTAVERAFVAARRAQRPQAPSWGDPPPNATPSSTARNPAPGILDRVAADRSRIVEDVVDALDPRPRSAPDLPNPFRLALDPSGTLSCTAPVDRLRSLNDRELGAALAAAFAVFAPEGDPLAAIHAANRFDALFYDDRR